MMLIKRLRTALIAIAMLTSPAATHASSVTGRHVVAKRHPGIPPRAQWIYQNTNIATSSSKSSMISLDELGGGCDHGDNPMVC